MQDDRQYIERVIALAKQNVLAGGRPFACIIANSETGEVLAQAANQVAQTGDPSAHAEILAINEASKILRAKNAKVDGKNGTAGEDMEGYTIYILPKPCTMCMAAMAYAGPDRIVYALTREAYSTYYRDDRRYFQMETLSKATALIIEESQLNVEFCPHPEAIKVYQLWQQKNEK